MAKKLIKNNPQSFPESGPMKDPKLVWNEL